MPKAEQYFNKRAPTYDTDSELFYFRVYDTITWKYTEPYIPKNSDALILDAAGGTGKWAIPIARHGPKVILMDISDEMLNVARKKIVEQGLQGRITLKKGDIQKLGFLNETFDMVFCDHALCYVQEHEVLIRELVRVLKTNRPIIISAQNRYVLSLSLISRDIDFASKVLFGKTPFLLRNFLEVYTLSPDEFRRLLKQSGVRIEKIIGKGITMPLGITPEKFWTKHYKSELLEKVLTIELNLCNKPDALALAGHLQAVGYKTENK